MRNAHSVTFAYQELAVNVWTGKESTVNYPKYSSIKSEAIQNIPKIIFL